MEADAVDYYEIIESVLEKFPKIENHDEQQIQSITSQHGQTIDPNLAFWAVVDGVLLVFILGGNILIILAVRFSRRLRSIISNLFILSLAISDMVVGFTLPYHLAFYMGSRLGKSREWCLLRFFLIILACCVSIWNLIAIAVDRYIAIIYPLHYSRYMTRKVAFILLGIGWIIGGIFAMIPMFWNNWETAMECEFDEILPPWYMAGIITPGFIMVWICMLVVYWRIWREASKQVKQLRSSFTGLHETPSDWKSVQVVLFILGCFSICWLPYFIIACAQIFKFVGKSSPMLYKGAFSLAMANSGINPIIYAWKNSNFRRAFGRLLRCKSPDCNEISQHSIRSNNLNRKSLSLHHQDTLNPTPPSSAVTGHFNMFDEQPKDLNNVGNEEYKKPSATQGRRISLALTHSTCSSTPPPPQVPPLCSPLAGVIVENENQKFNKDEFINDSTKTVPISTTVCCTPNGGSTKTQKTTISSPNFEQPIDITHGKCIRTKLSTNVKFCPIRKLFIEHVDFDGNGNKNNRNLHLSNSFSEKDLPSRIEYSTTIACKSNKSNKETIQKCDQFYVQKLSNGNSIVSSITNYNDTEII